MPTQVSKQEKLTHCHKTLSLTSTRSFWKFTDKVPPRAQTSKTDVASVSQDDFCQKDVGGKIVKKPILIYVKISKTNHIKTLNIILIK